MNTTPPNGLCETAEARAYLGLRYRRGDGVKKNLKEAARLFRLAADAGSDVGRLHLGLSYLDGEGVEEDEEEAVNLFLYSGGKGLF